jgi:hypothetical protein
MIQRTLNKFIRWVLSVDDEVRSQSSNAVPTIRIGLVNGFLYLKAKLLLLEN